MMKSQDALVVFFQYEIHGERQRKRQRQTKTRMSEKVEMSENVGECRFTLFHILLLCQE